jgi:hypothetical protein
VCAGKQKGRQDRTVPSKGKVDIIQDMKTYERIHVQDQSFLTSAVVEDERSASFSSRFNPGQSPLTAMGPRTCVGIWTGDRSFARCRELKYDPWVVHPVAWSLCRLYYPDFLNAFSAVM